MEIKIYVVTTKLNNPQQHLSLLKNKVDLIKLFNGLTEDKTTKKGYWIDSKNKIDCDKVITWTILTTSEDLKKNLTEFEKIINSIKVLTVQESQLYTLNPEIKAFFV